MNVLVTGATGFIGAALTERLVARGERVRALVRRSSITTRLEHLGVELVRGDVRDRLVLADAVDGCELVLHLAGTVKALRPAELFHANADGTRNVAEACAAAARRPRLVYVSSLAAAGPSDGGPLTEDELPAPVSFYGESKLAGERAVRAVADKIEASIVRPPIVYGPGDREFMPPLLRMVRLGLVLRPGFAEKRYSLVYLSDLIDGVLAVAERGKRLGATYADGVYFLDSGPDAGWGEIVRAAAAAAGRRTVIVPVPDIASTVAAGLSTLVATLKQSATILSLDKLKEVRQRAWTCCSAAARAEVGYAPRYPLAEGMAEAVAWFKERGEI